MAADGEIDYRGFTREQLEEALAHSDRERFSLNHARLSAALDQLRQEAFLSSLPPPSAGRQTRHALEFTGTGADYFRIWIVNLALTILTLGFYSAWAKVRKQRYFYSSTRLDGSAFGYHGEPLKILKGRIIAALLIAAYFVALRISLRAALSVIVILALVAPWLVVKSRAFISRVSSWRGIRFSFRQDFVGAYKVMVGYLLLAIVTFGLMLPRLTRERYAFLVSRTSFGDEEFQCSPRTGPFFRAAWAGGALVAGVGIITKMLMSAFTHSDFAHSLSPTAARIATLALPLANYAIIGPVFLGYTRARYLNELFNQTALGAHRLAADFEPGKLISIYLTNVLLIIATAGLYIPWAEVRIARYRCESLALLSAGPLSDLDATPRPDTPSAAGEEISSFFDLDFGF